MLSQIFLESHPRIDKRGLNMASGIKDKVAILGMGCSQFGERWDKDSPDLMAEAFDEALLDAGVERNQIDAAWYGCCTDSVNVGNSAIPASTALRLDGIPVSRMENMCATGTEALRGATYAVAAGAADIALAIGAEKLKDTGYGGLPPVFKGNFNELWLPLGSAPAGFAQSHTVTNINMAYPGKISSRPWPISHGKAIRMVLSAPRRTCVRPCP